MFTDTLKGGINDVRRTALLIGVAGLLFSLLALVFSPARFFQSWLVAYVLVFGLAAGGLFGVLLRHLAGGAWSVVIQRLCEAASRTLWVFAPLFLLLFLLGKNYLYPWTDPAYVADHHVVANKTAYLNTPFFLARFVVYFAVWGALAWVCSHWSARLDATGDARYAVWMRRLSAPAMIVMFLTMTLAATDWGMSTEPEWFSTIYGPLWIVSQGLSILALCIIAITYMDSEPPLAQAMNHRQYLNLGNLLLAFTVLWSYISFSQYLIIWSGNLPEEIGWYLKRDGGGLTGITVILSLFHFLVPMIVLLFRQTKEGVLELRRIAYLLLVMRVVDVYWNLVPSFAGHANRIDLSTTLFVIAAVAALGGLWLWHFLGELLKRPLLPVNDPRAEMLLLKETREAHGHA
ncbi:MAG TPA: hypothetical protein PKI11_10175 [Candidatus Hydrogenedentes bacterium]|nr:hypothetical protein [Candidatus Hydrogenedentota bacterium]